MSSYRPVVAIAGLNGALGQATLDALLSTQFMASFQLPVRVLMRTPLNFQGPMYPAGMVSIALTYFWNCFWFEADVGEPFIQFNSGCISWC